MSAKMMQNKLLATINGLLSSNTTSHVVKLYTNNKTPAVGDAANAYTEATFGGYAAVNFPSNPSPVFDSATSSYSATYTAVQFAGNGTGSPQQVVGYFVVDSGGVLAYADQFPSTVQMGAAGTVLSLTIVLADLNG